MAEKKISPKAPAAKASTAKKSPATRVTKKAAKKRNFRRQVG